MISSTSQTRVKDYAFYVPDTISETASEIYCRPISVYLPNIHEIGLYAFSGCAFEDADICVKDCEVGNAAFAGTRFLPFYD